MKTYAHFFFGISDDKKREIRLFRVNNERRSLSLSNEGKVKALKLKDPQSCVFLLFFLFVFVLFRNHYNV